MRGLQTITAAFIILSFVVSGSFAYADHAVDINTADAKQLATLKGIGEVKSQNIIDYRESNGLFSKIEDIQNVSGIGPATYEDIKDHIVASGGQDTGTSEDSKAETTGSSDSTDDSSGASRPQVKGATYTSELEQSPQRAEKRISADAGPDRTVAVGAPVEFAGKGYGFTGDLLQKADYRWNFGDGYTAFGKNKTHFYRYTGDYVVVLTVSAGEYTDSDRAIISVRDPDFSITAEPAPESLITITNESDREMDLSGWSVTAGGREFVLPEDTIALPEAKIRLPKEVTQFAFTRGAPVGLHYPSGLLAASHIWPSETSSRDKYIPPARSAASGKQNNQEASSTENFLEGVDVATSSAAAVGALDSSGTGNGRSFGGMWAAAFMGLVILAAAAAVFVRRGKNEGVSSFADEFEIVED